MTNNEDGYGRGKTEPERKLNMQLRKQEQNARKKHPGISSAQVSQSNIVFRGYVYRL